MTTDTVSFFNSPYPIYVSPQMRRAQQMAARLPRPHRPAYSPRPRNDNDVNNRANNANNNDNDNNN